MMMTKEELREIVRQQLDVIIAKVNLALRGKNMMELHATLERVGRGGKVPHWFEQLEAQGTLPNLDGKTIGSIVEMLLIGVLESDTFKGIGPQTLRINPARGVDLPDLDLGVKSPSENYCTSEPYFSAYERLSGSEHDALVLLTDYQNAKKKPPLKLQIIKWDYLTKTLRILLQADHRSLLKAITVLPGTRSAISFESDHGSPLKPISFRLPGPTVIDMGER